MLSQYSAIGGFSPTTNQCLQNLSFYSFLDSWGELAINCHHVILFFIKLHTEI